jgi:hypothetical protein
VSDEDLAQQLRAAQDENHALRLQLAAQAEGRALMWLTLVNLRNGVYRFRDIPGVIAKVIGEGDDPADDTPEREAVEHRREMAVARAAWREAAMRATRDADLMALIVGALELRDGQVSNVDTFTLPADAWTEIQEAVARSRERTSGQ